MLKNIRITLDYVMNLSYHMISALVQGKNITRCLSMDSLNLNNLLFLASFYYVVQLFFIWPLKLAIKVIGYIL